jgi:diguanylate cyclase (GGDEF)-like protein/PAS domain S-box-containing protein
MQRRILLYALIGFGLGAIFPVVGTLYQLSSSGTSINLDSVLILHANRPIIFLLDMIPLVLASSFALIGLQSARINQQSNQLQTELEKQSVQIQNEHYFLEALINNSSFAVVRLDTDYQIITCNQAFEKLFGYTLEEIAGNHLDDLISSGEFLDEASQMSRAVSGGNLVRKTSKRQRKDGSLIDLEIVGVPVTVAGKNIGILGLYHDISPRKEAEAALRDRESRFRSLFNQSPISLWEEDFSEVKRILDKIGDKEQIIHELNRDYELVTKCVEAVKIINVNQATLDLYNASSSDELTNNLSEIFVIESLDEFRKEILALVNGETTFECEIYNKKLNGELIYGWLKLSLPPGYEDSWERVQISILDITERKEVEEKLRYMSFHDVLTGLYNRAYFEEELERLSGSRQYPVSIIACDLDGLKQINDEFGHDTGDKAIKAAARVLDLGTFRKEDVVARIGGDEFVIILPFVDLNKTPSILDRIIDSISQYNNSSLDDDLYRPISLSLGHAVVEKGEDLHEGYKSADRAMYASKIKKKGRGSQ